MKLLILGGHGLIGSAIAKLHKQLGDEVFVYDKHLNSHIDYSNCGMNWTAYPLEALISEKKFDVISHQAALVSMIESQSCIQKYVDNNISITSELLQALYNLNYKPKLILGSSMGFLKHSKTQEPLDEDYPCEPQSYYGISKMCQEQMVKLYAEQHSLNAIALRYFSVQGDDLSIHNKTTGVLNFIARQILEDNRVVLNEDGLMTRDIVSVQDVAEAHVLACKTWIKGFDTFNIGTGIGTPLIEVAKKMIKELKPKTPIVCNGVRRQGDIRYSCANIRKAKKILKWAPNITLDDMVKSYCAKLRNQYPGKTDNMRSTNKSST